MTSGTRIPNNVLELKFGLGCRIDPIKPWNCLHRHNEIEFSFFKTGPVFCRFRGEPREVQENQTLLFWGAIPHQWMETGVDNLHYWITIPLGVMIRWGLPEKFLQDILNGTMISDQDEELRKIDELCLARWSRELHKEADTYGDIISLAIEARIRLMALAYGKRPKDDRFLFPQDRSRFSMIYDYITRNFSSHITIDDIARYADIHPNYTSELFRSKTGMGIVDYITMLRIHESQRLLLTTDKKIIDIALDAGFGSISNFYRCFHQATGQQPLEYRTSILGD